MGEGAGMMSTTDVGLSAPNGDVTLQQERDSSTGQIKRQIAGGGLCLLIMIIARWGTAEFAHHAFIHSWFAQVNPGSNPPWFFIGLVAVKTPYDLLLVAIGCATVFVTRRLTGPHAWAMLGMAASNFGDAMASAINVFVNTASISNRDVATTAWKSFEDFQTSKAAAWDAGQLIGIVLWIAVMVQYTRALRAEARELTSRDLAAPRSHSNGMIG
jgi:hypothetical protein